MALNNTNIENRPLNIVLYSNSFLPQVGGREIVVYHLAKALIESGHNARVVCSGGWWGHRRLRFPFAVHRWPSIPGLSLEASSRVNLAIDTARHGCDIINAHATYPAGYIAIRDKEYSKLPLVITPHGEDIHIIPEINHGLRLIPELAAKIDRVVNTAEYMTAISGSVVASLLHANAPSDRIKEIPNGVDFTRFKQANRISVREQFNISTCKKVLLTVGNYVRRRGHEELVDAMRYIVDSDKDAHLVIVGRGTEVLHERISLLGLQESVTLTGAISPIEVNPDADDLVAALYQDCDVYVAPGMSEGSEGLSLALLDAMAASAAIVATQISGNSDVIRHGENGLLVTPGEPEALSKGVLDILTNKDLREKCKKNACEDVNPYSWSTISEQYVACYREAIRMCRK